MLRAWRLWQSGETEIVERENTLGEREGEGTSADTATPLAREYFYTV